MSLAPAPEVIFRALDDGAVLVHLSGNQIYELNETAAHVWTQLANGAAEDAIVASVVDAFDVDATTASREVGELIRRFIEQGLVRT
jgi:hypothetical protein